MKTRILLIFAVLLMTACSNDKTNNEFDPRISYGDGFWIEITAVDNSGVEYDEIISTSDITAYDFSTHKIYLKKSKPYISGIQSVCPVLCAYCQGE
jgi:hypothetical protein